MSLLIAAVAAIGSAAAIAAPEIDPGMGLNALALLGGATLVFRSSRRK